MKLNDLQGREQIRDTNYNRDSMNVNQRNGAAQPNALDAKAISSELQPGKVISGEVIANEKGDLQIKLLNDLLLNAKLDQNIDLETGKTFHFQVRSNGQTIMLTPLQTNLSVEGPVMTALDMAGLPLNSATDELTRLLMQAGMPIDKNSLQQVYREMINHPAGQISDLVDLHRLGMKVTDENLEQMSSYKNLTHQLSNGLSEISTQVFETISELQKQGNTSQSTYLYGELLNIVSGGTKDIPDQSEVSGLVKEILTMQSDVTSDAEPGTLLLGNSATGTDSGTKQIIDMGNMDQITNQSEAQMTSQNPNGSDKIIQNGFQENLNAFLSRDDLTQEMKVKVLSELFREAYTGNSSELLKMLNEDPQIKKFLANELERQWTIKPEQVADQKEVERLYQRLEGQLKNIANLLENTGQTQGNTYQTVMNMTNNLDFLQEINQMYAYVQLPLHLQQGDAHGDLYVYANKKNLASKDGPITALLHLDMEHLGPIDVYVSMQMEKVNTNFKVANDEMLDFLEEHMHILTERLEKRGYHLSVTTSLKDQGEKTQSGINPVLDQNAPGIMIQHKGFDMRT